ncbi:Conserved DNA-binding protein YbaB [Actinacidiphila yanglinensis]|uniref:Conserved DNA-binding protein YbaB n=1 Tax=Actinacidiphila yanglinensis TaxID=310779 RepID=A0A1H6E451_9ACTN|nr:YbaB/EbfC family nucleoid-associated protein [Actinacidiphila yanglinensis]SEG92023.1 Conserved DNA-binding protein YbaB [Actinacidiphila yanglinensis]
MDRARESRLQGVLDHFAAEHRTQAKAKEQIASLSVQARSRDGSVEVTVAGCGDVRALSFPGERFRQMAGRTLADSLLEALAAARIELARRTASVVESLGLLPSQVPDASLFPDFPDLPDPVPACDPSAPCDLAAAPAAQDPALPAAPDSYWRRFVGEARAVVAGGPAGADPARDDVPFTRGPLWGSERHQQQFAFRHAPVPVELRSAALALGDAVRCAVTTLSQGPGQGQGQGQGPVPGAAAAGAADLGTRRTRDLSGRSVADPPPACA